MLIFPSNLVVQNSGLESGLKPRTGFVDPVRPDWLESRCMSDEKKILLVEDDAELRGIMREALLGAGYRVLEAEGIEVGLHLFRAQKPDLAVLDVNLPDGSGLDLCRGIRASKSLSATPVIMLTGQGKLEEKSAGFGAGADQYLVKPVQPGELLLWVEALLRRLKIDRGEGDEAAFGDLVIDLKSQLVRVRGQVLSNLTTKEFELLYFLAKRSPQILSRKFILSHLWHTITVDHVVDTHITNLRKKLPSDISDRIQNIPGKGFRYL